VRAIASSSWSARLTLMRYFEFEDNFYIAYNTLALAFRQIIRSLISILPIFVGYVFIGTILFGDYCEHVPLSVAYSSCLIFEPVILIRRSVPHLRCDGNYAVLHNERRRDSGHCSGPAGELPVHLDERDLYLHIHMYASRNHLSRDIFLSVLRATATLRRAALFFLAILKLFIQIIRQGFSRVMKLRSSADSARNERRMQTKQGTAWRPRCVIRAHTLIHTHLLCLWHATHLARFSEAARHCGPAR
jgi:hypothetical protein